MFVNSDFSDLLRHFNAGAAPTDRRHAPWRGAAVLRPCVRRLRSHDLTTEGINVRAEERRAGQFRIVRPAPDAHALRPETDGDGLPRSAGGRLDVHIVRVRRGNCADDRTKTVVAVDVRPTIAESILGADGDETAIAAGENWTVRVGTLIASSCSYR